MAYKRRLRFDKRIRFRKSMSIMYILLFVVLASLGVGYSYIKSNLNINGTANVTAANWDVHFANLQVTPGSVTASSPATITNDTTVEFAATLDESRDFYEFTVDIVNDGTVDAMIGSVNISPTLTAAQQVYLHYDISYLDGTPLKENQALRSGETETIAVTFEYAGDLNREDYPTADQSLNINITINYVQATNDIEEIRNYIYRTDYDHVEIGTSLNEIDNPITSLDGVYSSPFIRHNIQNNKVVSADIGFFYGNEYYLLASTHKAAYYYNKQVLKNAFGEAYCAEDVVGGEYDCSRTYDDEGITMNLSAGTSIYGSHYFGSNNSYSILSNSDSFNSPCRFC